MKNCWFRRAVPKQIEHAALTSTLIFLLALMTAADAKVPAVEEGDLSRLSLQELMDLKVNTVYSASRHEQKISEAPASVSIVTADEIRKFGFRTVADILRSQRGIFVTYDRNYHYIGIRGLNRPGDYNTRLLVLVDGHRVNDNIYDGALVGNDFVADVDLIERVEVIRGPSSSLYGNNAFFGVVNVITKRGEHVNGAEVSGEVARFDTWKGRVTYGKKFENSFNLLLSGTLFTSDGPEHLYFPEFDAPETNHGIAENLDYERSRSAFGKLSYGDFTFTAAHVRRKKGIPTASFESVFNDPRLHTVDESTYYDLKFDREFDNVGRLLARMSYDVYEYSGDYPIDMAAPGDPPTIVLNKDFACGDWWTSELQFSREFYDRHRLTIGTEYRQNLNQDQFNYDEEPRFDYLNIQRSSYNAGIYGQAEILIRTNLLLNVGGRYDYYETFGGTANPRLGLIFSPWEETTFKLLYGRAFRAPNAYEFYYVSSDADANPDLQPEAIDTYELVYEQGLPGSIQMMASAFYYKVDGLISQQTDPVDDALVFRNVEEVQSRGVSFQLEHRSDAGWLARGSYTFQDTEDTTTGLRLSNSPAHLARFNFIVPMIPERLFAGLELQYSSSVKTILGRSVDDYWVANLTLFSQNLFEGLELSASLYNLFDQEFGYPGAGEHRQEILLQDGLTFRVKATYRF
ncbi:MAG: TonB-dependent receptor [Verrucomicrobiota bacterium]